jgi:hypothetical protein
LLTQVLDIKSLAPEVQKELRDAKELCKQGPSLLKDNIVLQNQEPKGVLLISYQDLEFDNPEKRVR